MKIAVIGASGNLGGCICRQALQRKYEVKGIVRHGQAPEGVTDVVRKDVFDLEKEDLEDADVILSAFGGGFKEPEVNKKVFDKYIEIMEITGKPVIAVGGAGSLYTDSDHTKREYEQEGYSEKLRAVSQNIREGIALLEARRELPWTVVCPARMFDLKGAFTGKVTIAAEEEIIYNGNGESYVTYEDAAFVMLDTAESGAYQGQVITVVTEGA